MNDTTLPQNLADEARTVTRAAGHDNVFSGLEGSLEGILGEIAALPQPQRDYALNTARIIIGNEILAHADADTLERIQNDPTGFQADLQAALSYGQSQVGRIFPDVGLPDIDLGVGTTQEAVGAALDEVPRYFGLVAPLFEMEAAFLQDAYKVGLATGQAYGDVLENVSEPAWYEVVGRMLWNAVTFQGITGWNAAKSELIAERASDNPANLRERMVTRLTDQGIANPAIVTSMVLGTDAQGNEVDNGIGGEPYPSATNTVAHNAFDAFQESMPPELADQIAGAQSTFMGQTLTIGGGLAALRYGPTMSWHALRGVTDAFRGYTGPQRPILSTTNGVNTYGPAPDEARTRRAARAATNTALTPFRGLRDLLRGGGSSGGPSAANDNPDTRAARVDSVASAGAANDVDGARGTGRPVTGRRGIGGGNTNRYAKIVGLGSVLFFLGGSSSETEEEVEEDSVMARILRGEAIEETEGPLALGGVRPSELPEGYERPQESPFAQYQPR